MLPTNYNFINVFKVVDGLTMNKRCHFPHKFRDSNNSNSKNIFRESQKCVTVTVEKPRKLNGICHKNEKQPELNQDQSNKDLSAAELLRHQLEEILKQMLSIWVKEIVSLRNFTNKKSGKSYIERLNAKAP